MKKTPDILMICLGNICRSPLAEGIMRSLIEQHHLDLKVGSAGTGRWHVGEPPHRGSLQVAQKHGLDLSQQRSEHISSYALDQIPYLCVMDESNHRDVLQAYPSLKQRAEPIWILRQFEEDTKGQALIQGVPDPYYGNGQDAFEEVFQIISVSCRSFLEYIKRDMN